MPIPTPEQDESRDDFVQRCMANPKMIEEFPEESQRLAVCSAQWEDPQDEEKAEDKTEGKAFFKGILAESEEDALELVQMQHDLEPQGLGFKRLTTFGIQETNEEERWDVATITDESVDEDAEIVKSSGLDLTRFRKNPVVVLNHDYQELPVAKVQWIKQLKHEVRAKTLYPKRPKDFEGEWKTDTVFALIKNGILNAKSIGFIGLEAHEPTRKEISERPDLKGVRKIIDKALLLEVSCVTLGCNANALVTAVSKGLILPQELESVGIEPPEIKEIEEVVTEIKHVRPRYAKSLKQIERELTEMINEKEIMDRLLGRP